MDTTGYESWFVSARDPASPRALWIRRTRLQPAQGPESLALWCAVFDARQDQPPVMIKEVAGAFPPGTVASAEAFRGQATTDGEKARWDLTVTSGQQPLRPLRPAALYRAPLPRTKLVAEVPDGEINGTLEAGGQQITVSGWRGTVGRNWGSEHADTWVWLHAAGFGAAPEAWLDLVLARIKVGPARSPWTAMGALGLAGERITLGGLGRPPLVDAEPDRLTARIASPRARLLLSVAAGDTDAVAVTYADPQGGTRTVRHAALAGVRLTLRRPGHEDLTLSSSRAAYEYGTAQPAPGIVPLPLPFG